MGSRMLSPTSTPRGASRTLPPESQRSDFSTPTPQRAAPSPSPSPSSQNHESPVAAPAVVFTPPPALMKVAPPLVPVPPPQYEKPSAGGKHDGSAFGFFWDAIARVQEGSKAEEPAASADPLAMASKGGAVHMVCRTCGKKGDHWTSKKERNCLRH